MFFHPPSCLGVEGDAVEDRAKGSLEEGENIQEANVVLAVEFLVGAKGQHAYELLLVGVAMLLQQVTMLLQQVALLNDGCVQKEILVQESTKILLCLLLPSRNCCSAALFFCREEISSKQLSLLISATVPTYDHSKIYIA